MEKITVRHRVLGTLVVLLTCLGIGYCLAHANQAAVAGKSASPTSGAEVKVGLAVENLELSGASDGLEIAPETKIYAWSRVKDVEAGSKVTIAFKKGDKAAYSREILVPSVPYRVFVFRIFHKGDEGDWTAVLSGPDGKELGSTTFKVAIKP